MTATVIASASLIIAFALWIVFLLTNSTKFRLHREAAKAARKRLDVIEGEYEVIDETRGAPYSQGRTCGQQDEGTSR